MYVESLILFQTLQPIFVKPKDTVTKEQQTDAIYSIRAMTVITSVSDRSNVSLTHFERALKSSLLLHEKIQLRRSTHAQLTIQLGGISIKLSPLIDITTRAFVWKHGISTPPTLL